MRIRLPHFILATLLASIGVQATLVDFTFSGIVTEQSNPFGTDFSSLIATGDAVSGSIQFDFNPPGIFNIGSQAAGSFSVPAGTVSPPFFLAAVGGPTGILAYAGGTGVSGLAGANPISLTGFEFATNIDPANSTLADYLALTAADLSNFFLLGHVIFTGTSSESGGTVAAVDLITASFTVAPNVPDGGATALLLASAALPLAIYGRKSGIARSR